MIGKQIRMWHFDVRISQSGSSSHRELSAVTAIACINKAISLYIQTWQKPPDKVEVICKNTYTIQ
jgi:hypothetical protein